MAYRGGGEGGSGGPSLGPMSGPVVITIGLIVMVAILQFAPTIGGSIYNAQPVLGATNPWNATYNTNLPSPTTFYQNNIGLIQLLVVIIIISLVIAYLVRI
jgi:hypothetical protein